MKFLIKLFKWTIIFVMFIAAYIIFMIVSLNFIGMESYG